MFPNKMISVKKPCRDGQNCKRPDCMFNHQTAKGPTTLKNNFQSLEKQVKQCKLGASCPFLAKGNCYYKHEGVVSNRPSRNLKSQFKKDPSQQLCKFQGKCNKYKDGTCKYKHDPKWFIKEISKQQEIPLKQQSKSISQRQPQVNNIARPQPVQNIVVINNDGHNAVFNQICFNYIQGSCQNSCNKMHEYTLLRSSVKYFGIDGCQNSIQKVKILKINQQQQPIFVLLKDNKISFAKLTNLARESGFQNIDNNTMVLKKCFANDIFFQNDTIQNFWIKNIGEGQRQTHYLILKCRQSLKFVSFNNNPIFQLMINKPIKHLIAIQYFVIILLNDNSIKVYQQKERKFIQNNQKQFPPLLSIYSKIIKGQIVSSGITKEGTIFFISKRLNFYQHKLPSKAVVLEFVQFMGIPTVLIGTQNNNIYAVNLLTFQQILIFQSQFRQNNIKIIQIKQTNNNLIISFVNYGIIIVKMDSTDKCQGFLDIGSIKSQVDCDSKGNVVLLCQKKSRKRFLSLFKLNKI